MCCSSANLACSDFKQPIIWFTTFVMVLFHVGALAALFSIGETCLIRFVADYGQGSLDAAGSRLDIRADDTDVEGSRENIVNPNGTRGAAETIARRLISC